MQLCLLEVISSVLWTLLKECYLGNYLSRKIIENIVNIRSIHNVNGTNYVHFEHCPQSQHDHFWKPSQSELYEMITELYK